MELVSEKSFNRKLISEYKSLLKVSYQDLSKSDKLLIRKSLDLAVKAHTNQTRKSGIPYVFHPLSVAKIVAQKIGLDAQSIASALLHDVVEDSEYDLNYIETKFGKKLGHEWIHCNLIETS